MWVIALLLLAGWPRCLLALAVCVAMAWTAGLALAFVDLWETGRKRG